MMSDSVRFRSEQISAVTDSVPEQRHPDRTITREFQFSFSSTMQCCVQKPS